MKKYLALSVLPVLLLTLFGCGGGSSSGSGSDAVNVTGTWKGTGNAPETGTLPTTLILNQTGNNVSGTWDGYALTGTISGNQLNMTLIPHTEGGVNFTGGGSATVTGNSMSGTMTLTGTKGSSSKTINGTFTATRSSSNAKYITGTSPEGGLVGAIMRAIAN